jgi:hypothetical protein
VFLLRQYYKTNGGKLVIDRLMLNSPVLGNLLRKSAVSRFTRTLGTLVSLGRVDPGRAADHRAHGGQPRDPRRGDEESRASIAGGATISEPLKESKVFPPMVVQMINVGEQTGGLDEMLTKIADFYDDEVDAAVSALTSILEPDHDRGDGRGREGPRRRHRGRHVPADVRHDQRRAPFEGKGGEVEHRPGRAVPIAVAAAAVAAGGAAVVVVRRRRRKAEEAAEAERGKAKRARGSSRKPGDGAAKKPRAAGGGLSQPVRPDAALGAVIGGTQPRTRAEITRQVWDYIKSKGLQDAVNRRSINADATLRPVFGKDQVTMFELPRAINDHVEKV